MSYPGLFVVLLGFGLATVLYLMFGGDEEEQRHHSAHRTRDLDESENYREMRRSCSERRLSRNSTGNLECCSICLGGTTLNDVLLHPCKHIFHLNCIKMWYSEGTQGKLCPNCRRPFKNTL